MTRDLYSNDVETAAYLARMDADEYDYDRPTWAEAQRDLDDLRRHPLPLSPEQAAMIRKAFEETR